MGEKEGERERENARDGERDGGRERQTEIGEIEKEKGRDKRERGVCVSPNSRLSKHELPVLRALSCVMEFSCTNVSELLVVFSVEVTIFFRRCY